MCLFAHRNRRAWPSFQLSYYRRRVWFCFLLHGQGSASTSLKPASQRPPFHTLSTVSGFLGANWPMTLRPTSEILSLKQEAFILWFTAKLRRLCEEWGSSWGKVLILTWGLLSEAILTILPSVSLVSFTPYHLNPSWQMSPFAMTNLLS